jgi:hypothetical protein
MIGRTKPRIRDRQPSALHQFMGGRRWRLLSAALCAVTVAGPPAAATPPGPPAPAGAQQSPAPATPQSPSQGTPDADFIEFLGGDDVGDAAWWEFLKKVPPRGGNPPAPPPQDAKQ